MYAKIGVWTSENTLLWYQLSAKLALDGIDMGDSEE